MVGFLLGGALGGAIGYVVGSRGGRDRYDQLVQRYERLADHPAVQGTAGVVRAKVENLVNRPGRG